MAAKSLSVLETEKESANSSQSHSVANSVRDHMSVKSVEAPDEVAEQGIEEAFEPARDEEVGFHQHGGQHVPDEKVSNLVEWDGPDDPENPMNMGFWRKVWITFITGMMTFVISFASSVFSTATVVTAEEFHVSEEVMILGVSLYVVGFACGPLVWGPMSEIFGRRNPLMIGTFAFIIFQIASATAKDLPTLFICRFFSAAFGSAPLAIVAGMYVDFWDTVSRSIATMGYAAAVFAAPALGPIVGDFTVKNPSLGWRWTAWFTVIMGAFFLILALPTIPETLHALLLQRKAARLRFETKNWALHSKLDEAPVSTEALLRKYGLKPILMMTQEPILIVMTIYISLVYGIMYLIFFAFPFSYQIERGWEAGISALPFLAIFIGVLIGCAYMAWETKAIFTPKMVKAKKLLPEERLPSMMVGSVVIVIGLFWSAWTSFPTLNAWPQIIAGVFIGAGIIMVFMPSMSYLVDVYLFDANSALAANSFIRSLVGAAFPLFSTRMYEQLGVRWATSLLAFLCVALVPAPILFYLYGKKIRSWSKFAFNLG